MLEAVPLGGGVLTWMHSSAHEGPEEGGKGSWWLLLHTTLDEVIEGSGWDGPGDAEPLPGGI